MRFNMGRPHLAPTAIALLVALTLPPAAQAFEIDTGNEDVKLRWDNTLKYSGAWRLKSQSDSLVASPTHDDGNRNSIEA